jgi:hypothetical protein
VVFFAAAAAAASSSSSSSSSVSWLFVCCTIGFVRIARHRVHWNCIMEWGSTSVLLLPLLWGYGISSSFFLSSLLFRRPTVFFCFVLLCFVRFLRFGVFGVCFVLCRFFPLSLAC